MPLPEQYKKDWDSRDLIGIDPKVDITTKILVLSGSCLAFLVVNRSLTILLTYSKY